MSIVGMPIICRIYCQNTLRHKIQNSCNVVSINVSPLFNIAWRMAGTEVGHGTRRKILLSMPYTFSMGPRSG